VELIVIGDSHTWVFKGYCKVVHIDNPTAHNIHNHKEKIEGALKKNDINIFSFGDIDCRVHFWNLANTYNFPVITLIQITVSRFLRFVIKYPKYDIRILSLPPCGTQNNRFKKEFYASYIIRKYIYFMYNQELESQCLTYHIPFINYYYDVIDENMDRREELIADECHLNKKALPFILRRIENEERNY
jgi:hypothetical protein